MLSLSREAMSIVRKHASQVNKKPRTTSDDRYKSNYHITEAVHTSAELIVAMLWVHIYLQLLHVHSITDKYHITLKVLTITHSKLIAVNVSTMITQSPMI